MERVVYDRLNLHVAKGRGFAAFAKELVELRQKRYHRAWALYLAVVTSRVNEAKKMARFLGGGTTHTDPIDFDSEAMRVRTQGWFQAALP